MLNLKNFQQTMTGLGELCNRVISNAAMTLYYTALKDLSDAEFDLAIDKILRTRKYTSLPMPAEIIEACRASEADETVLVILEIEEEMKRTAAHRIPNLSPRAAEVVKFLGGWERICMLETTTWNFERKRVADIMPVIEKSSIKLLK